MGRRLATSGVIVLLLAWTAAIALWTRGQWRADVVGLRVLHTRYVEVQSLDGDLTFRTVGDFPTATRAFWSSGPASIDVEDLLAGNAKDPLVGPDFEIGRWTGSPSWQHRWHRLAVGGGQVRPLKAFSPSSPTDQPHMTFPRRVGPLSGDFPTLAPRPTFWVSCPAAVPPIVTSAVLCIVACAAGWFRFRARSRRHRGLCVGCGYDRRHSPDWCPECGAGAEA